MELRPGDLVELVNTPPLGWHFEPEDPRINIGHRGVVLSEERAADFGLFNIVDVRLPYMTTDIAVPILRKISGPPEDERVDELDEALA